MGVSFRNRWDIRATYREHVRPTVQGLIRFFTHPIVVFVLLQLVCIAITVIWVVWFVSQDEALRDINRSLGASDFDRSFGIGLLVAGCILLGVVILGVIILFVFAQKQLRFNRQQQNFVSSVTHELRSPLASIQLAVETLQTRELNSETQKKMLEMTAVDILRLRKLVDQILVSAKLDRGIVDLERREKIDIKELIEHTIQNLAHADSNLVERVTVECPVGLDVNSTRDGLQLVLSNLIENAVKYSPAQSPIQVQARVKRGFVEIAVSDQGFGLLPREAKRVFRMFHRAEGATKQAIPGTGLGLYIVKTIVTALKGKTWAQSLGRGKGSTFYFTVPMRQP